VGQHGRVRSSLWRAWPFALDQPDLPPLSTIMCRWELMAKAKHSSSETTPVAAVPEGRSRAVIDALLPVVDAGRFPVKRIAGEPVRIEAHCLADAMTGCAWSCAGRR